VPGKYPLSFTALLIVGGTYSLWADEAHPNPLDAFNTHRRAKNPARSSRTSTPGRHYSPLDAMNGRMVIREHDQGDKQNKRPSVQHSRRRKHTAKLSPKPVVSHHSPLDVLSSNPKKHRRTTPNMEPSIPLETPVSTPVVRTLTRPASESAAEVSASRSNIPPAAEKTAPRPAAQTAEVFIENIGSESPVPHADGTPLVAVPEYKTLPIPKESPKTHATGTPHRHRKTLYLTFDDGPLKGTENLLNVLQLEDIPATLFCIGRNVVKNPSLFRRAASMPNLLIANHTYTHCNGHYRRFYSSAISHVMEDIDHAQAVIGGAKYLRLAGRDVWRLPHVRRNDWAIDVAERGREIPKYDALFRHGYFIYGWDIEWLFSHKTQRPIYSGEEMARRVNLQYKHGRSAKAGEIILLAHDFMWQTPANVRELKTFIEIMKAQGWEFKTIDQYTRLTPEAYAAAQQSSSPKPAAKKSPSLLVQNLHDRRPKSLAEETGSSPSKTIRITPEDLSEQLSHAIASQQLLLVRKLIAKGAKLNEQNAQGELPLNLAIKTNNAVLVRMLVERGASIFNIDRQGMSPMGVARERHNTVIIRYLIKEIEKQRTRRLHKTPYSLEA